MKSFGIILGFIGLLMSSYYVLQVIRQDLTKKALFYILIATGVIFIFYAFIGLTTY